MITLQIYDPLTGRIKRTVRCPEEQKRGQCQKGEKMLCGEGDNATCYIDQNRIVKKEKNPVVFSKIKVQADNQDQITISALHETSRIIIDGEEILVTDGELILTFDTPSQVKIKCCAIPFLDREVIINAI